MYGFYCLFVKWLEKVNQAWFWYAPEITNYRYECVCEYKCEWEYECEYVCLLLFLLSSVWPFSAVYFNFNFWLFNKLLLLFLLLLPERERECIWGHSGAIKVITKAKQTYNIANRRRHLSTPFYELIKTPKLKSSRCIVYIEWGKCNIGMSGGWMVGWLGGGGRRRIVRSAY